MKNEFEREDVERELHERNLQYFIQHSTAEELGRYREQIVTSFSH